MISVGAETVVLGVFSQIIILLCFNFWVYATKGNTLWPFPSISDTWAIKPTSFLARYFGSVAALQFLLLVIMIYYSIKNSKFRNPNVSVIVPPVVCLAFGVIAVFFFSLVPAICDNDIAANCRGNPSLHGTIAAIFFTALNLLIIFLYADYFDYNNESNKVVCVSALTAGATFTIINKILHFLGDAKNIFEWLDVFAVLSMMLVFVYYNNPINIKVNFGLVSELPSNVYFYVLPSVLATTACVFFVLNLIFTFSANYLQGRVDLNNSWPSIESLQVYPPSNWSTHWVYNMMAPFISIGQIVISLTWAAECKTPANSLLNAMLGSASTVAMICLAWSGETTYSYLHKASSNTFFIAYDIYMAIVIVWGFEVTDPKGFWSLVQKILKIIISSGLLTLVRFTSINVGLSFEVLEWINYVCIFAFVCVLLYETAPKVNNYVIAISGSAH